jgi:hypothetical protein
MLLNLSWQDIGQLTDFVRQGQDIIAAPACPRCGLDWRGDVAGPRFQRPGLASRPVH